MEPTIMLLRRLFPCSSRSLLLAAGGPYSLLPKAIVAAPISLLSLAHGKADFQVTGRSYSAPRHPQLLGHPGNLGRAFNARDLQVSPGLVLAGGGRRMFSTGANPPPGDFSNEATKWKEIEPISWKNLPGMYLEVSKAKLSALVVLTAMAGYAIAPGAVDLSTLLWTTVGTALCSASANSINQWIEVPYDAQMTRTRNRILVRKAMTPLHALSFGIASGVTGVATLATLVNPLTASLGLANIVLYTMIYTPLKRTSILNTWAGSLVGGIPPLMGWAACMGSVDIRAGVLAAFLYAWQFPHFNSLAWNLRSDYSKAGYRMMSVTDPALNGRVSLRYAASFIPLCLLMPYLDMTTWTFAYEATALNLVFLQRSWKFYQDPNQQTARDLFFMSLVYLPLVLIFMIFHKKRVVTAEEEDE